MNKFDKKVKELAKNITAPASYDEKVDKVLLDIMKEDRTILEKGKKLGGKEKNRRWLLRLAVCLLCILCVISLYTIDAHADFFAFFKETILDFLGRGNSDDDISSMGVDSSKQPAVSKPDLMMEMQETVIDNHSIYALVKVTAPPDIPLTKNTLFDYYCFCKGANFSTSQLLSGTRSCELLEVNEDYPNMATYVVSLILDETLEEGSEVTVCFRNLTLDPYSSDPQLLLSGIWSLTFFYYPSVTDHIELEGTPDMVFSFINTTATLMKLELSPFGIFLYADVSNFPSDELGISDTDIAIRLKMIDGTEITVVSHDPEEPGYVQGGNAYFPSEGDKTYEQVNLEFSNIIDIAKIAGVYIEDLYIPLK